MDNKDYILGVIDSPVDLRDYDYSMISSLSEKIDIPKEFILDYDYPILCQGQIGSCVAHALSEMKSYIDAVNSNDMYSVGFIYANRQENDYKGTGMVTREALKNLVKFGDCKKTSFSVNEEYPSIVTTLDKYNKEKLLDEADDHKSLAYISLSTEDIKEYLVKYQKPILLTCHVYDNFYEANTNKGIIPSTPNGSKQGSHAMLCIGYKEDELILINSWGDWNGDKGKYYLDIDSNIIKELWALEDIKNVKVPEVKIYKVGWNKNDKGWWYSEDGNTYYTECWKQIKGYWYYFNNEGYAIDGDWIQYKNKWYYLEKDTCAMAADKWISWKSKWYRVGNDGAMLKGWFQDDDTNWYYLDIDKGYTYTDCTILIDGKNYSFDNNGALKKTYLVSNSCIDFIKSWEGFSAVKYQDEVGVWTLGYGMTGEEIEGIENVTEEQATNMLRDWIESKYSPLIKQDLDSKGIELKQNEFDALVSMAYNVGTAGLLGSTLYKNVVAGVRDANTITANFQLWSNAGGKRLEGLYRRRTKEAAMFLNADYTGNN